MTQPAAERTLLACSIAPWLSVRRSVEAVDFYKAAFGAVVVHFVAGGEGGIVAQFSVDGAQFWMSEESVEHANFSPESLGGGSVHMILTVADPDRVVERALSAGAALVHPVGEANGWRVGRIVDPFGHHWEIGHSL
jgi:PhnB protein